jgi:hypothetical protein
MDMPSRLIIEDGRGMVRDRGNFGWNASITGGGCPLDSNLVREELLNR